MSAPLRTVRGRFNVVTSDSKVIDNHTTRECEFLKHEICKVCSYYIKTMSGKVWKCSNKDLGEDFDCYNSSVQVLINKVPKMKMNHPILREGMTIPDYCCMDMEHSLFSQRKK